MRGKSKKPITIREVPVDLWRKVKAKAILDGKNTRQVVIELFQGYIKKEGG